MRIAVLGGGNGGHAAAADLADRGHEVRFWRRDGAALAPLIDDPVLTLVDPAGERPVRLALVTPEIGAAIAGAELIVMPGPATAQADIAARMAPHLASGQVVLLPPGTFGSYLVARWVAEAGGPRDLILGESGTLPYLTRRRADGTANGAVVIVTRATRLPTGIFPAARSDQGFAVMTEAYPAIERLSDGLDGALMNAGPILHPPLILMNAGALQHSGDWDIHNEGTQRAIRDVTSRLDAERIALRVAFGYGAPHFPLADHYDADRPEWMYGNAGHDRLVVSDAWREPIDLYRHRYMREDLELGLVFLATLGAAANVATPIADALIELASAIVGEHLRLTGRSWTSTGLAELDLAELKQLLHDGLAP